MNNEQSRKLLKIAVCNTPENFQDNFEAVARRSFAKWLFWKTFEKIHEKYQCRGVFFDNIKLPVCNSA